MAQLLNGRLITKSVRIVIPSYPILPPDFDDPQFLNLILVIPKQLQLETLLKL